MAVILDGKLTSGEVKKEIADKVLSCVKKGFRPPCLSVIIVGENPASMIYVRNKKKTCEEIGFISKSYELPENTTEDELLLLVDKMNSDDDVDGILVQMPLPKHIDEQKVINRIDYKKDVDAFHPFNVGRIMIGDFNFLPCTPAGIMRLMDKYKINVEGKECVVVGRSNIVGKPMSMLLIKANGTVTVCHSKTKNLSEVTKRADILVVAIGRAKFITADMIKDGAVVIDVGMNRNELGKLCGDVDFAGCEPKCSAITPVPGGVGVMTIAMLMENTYRSYTTRFNI